MGGRCWVILLKVPDPQPNGNRPNALLRMMHARVRELVLHPAEFIDSTCSIELAARKMNEIDAKALFVREGDRIGIITKTDLADAAILQRLPIEAPVASVAQYKVVSVGADEFVSMALLQITKHNKRRVAVTEGGAYIGILEDVALLSFLAGNSQLVADRIDRAENVEDLAPAASSI